MSNSPDYYWKLGRLWRYVELNRLNYSDYSFGVLKFLIYDRLVTFDSIRGYNIYYGR